MNCSAGFPQKKNSLKVVSSEKEEGSKVLSINGYYGTVALGIFFL